MAVLIESNGYRGLFGKISLPCVSTPADIFLVFHTLLNCLKCIIYEDIPMCKPFRRFITKQKD